MKRWWLFVVLLLSLGVNLGLLASRAWQRSPGPLAAEGSPPPEAAERPPRFALRMAGELDLRGEQREAFLDRQRRFLEQTLDARDRFGRLQAELRREVVAEDPDRRAVDDLLVRISDAHVDLERAFVDNLLDTRELLGPEQGRRFMRLLHHLRSSRGPASRERERLRGERPSWRERREADRDRPADGRRLWGPASRQGPDSRGPATRRPPAEQPPAERPETDPPADGPLGQK